jgi:hypothetical protein
MEERIKQPLQATPVHYSMPLARNTYKKFGTFLYFTRAVDPRILMALSAIAAQQSTPTEETLKASINSLTTYGHTRMQKYVTEHPT